MMILKNITHQLPMGDPHRNRPVEVKSDRRGCVVRNTLMPGATMEYPYQLSGSMMTLIAKGHLSYEEHIVDEFPEVVETKRAEVIETLNEEPAELTVVETETKKKK